MDPKSNLDHSGPDEVSTDTLQEPVPPTGAKIHAPTGKKEQDGTPYMDVEEVQTEVSCEEILSNDGLDASHSQQGISSKYPMLSTTSPPMDPYTYPKEQSSPMQTMKNLKWTVLR